MCGEQAYPGYARMPITGSPPRVRGTDLRAAAGIGGVGITPACAGNRTTWKDENGNTWDHPRVCGEQLKLIDEGAKPQGSPPRVRGTAARIFR